jgi:hypothetical protein
MQNASREGKYSVYKLEPNFSVYLRLDTHYESKVLTASAKIITIHFVLRVGSAEFQASRLEAGQKITRLNQSLLDSHRYNHPSSAKICFNITSIEGIEDFK